MESIPPTPKSVTLLLNLLNQEPVPNEINIAILDVPNVPDDGDDVTKIDYDSSTIIPNHGSSCRDSDPNANKQDINHCVHCPEKSYAKIETHLGIHAPHLPMLARDFRTEYFSLRHLLRDCFDDCKNSYDRIAKIPEGLLPRMMGATTCLLLVCPDHSTAWADRRRALLEDGGSIDENSLAKELDFLNLLFTQHSKAPSSWGHRKWISLKLVGNYTSKQKKGALSVSEPPNAGRSNIETESDRLFQWATSEIATCALVSERFPKNYYSWTHRRWVCRLLFGLWHNHLESDSKICSNYVIKTNLLFQLLNKEMSNCSAWMRSHISDHSAVHYQGEIMRMLLAVGLHPENGYFCHQQSQLNERASLASDIVMNSMEAARNSRFLSHEVTWIHRRICGFTYINLLEGCLFGDGVSKDWLVEFDPTPFSTFADEFITKEVLDLFGVYSKQERSLEKNNALAYIVWMGNQIMAKIKVLREDLVIVTKNALSLLGHDDSIVGNEWRVMMERSQA